MEVAIFGGSFDPIHKGHLEIIKKLSEKFQKVIVLPNYLNPLKNSFSAPPQKRVEWIKRSVKQKNVEVSEFEIQQNRPCYTIDTIKHFSKKYDKIYFVIGADNLETLDKWKDIEKLKKMVEFVVVSRHGKKSEKFKNINLNIPISSTAIRESPQKEREFLPDEIADEVISYYSKKGVNEKEN